MKIRGKIFVWIMSTTFLFFLFVVGFLSLNFHKESIEKAKQLTDSQAQLYASRTKMILDNDMATLRTVAHVMNNYNRLSPDKRNELYNIVMQSVLESNPKFFSIWTSWELSALRDDWTKPYGRVRTLWLRTPKGVFENQIDTPNIHGDDPQSLYYRIKTSAEIEHTVDPYFYTYESNTISDSVLETSLAVQIRNDGVYRGLVGVDVALDNLIDLVNQKLPFENSYMFLLSNNGTVIAHPNAEYIGKHASKIYNERYHEYRIFEKIKAGKKFAVDGQDISEIEQAYTSFVPIYVGNSKTPWTVGVSVPIKSVTREAVGNFYFSFIVGIIGFTLLSIIIFIVSENITGPLHKTIRVLHKLDSGDISTSNKLDIKRKDEMGDVAASLNTLIETLNFTADFAVKIGHGKLDTQYESLGPQDVLGNALVEMRKNLIVAEADRTQTRIEAEKRTWVQNGIAEIGDILRESYDNFEDLSYAIVKTAVKYLRAAQGGMFVAEDSGSDEKLILRAAYAYDKKKKLDSEFSIGEGLIGRAAREKQFIQLSQIPPGYTFIGSGLGEEMPRILALLPLVHDDKTFGVLEIAGFNTFEPYQIEFLQNIGQRVASVISNIRANIETKELLEQFKEQSEKLALKEFESLQAGVELKRTKQLIGTLQSQILGIEKALSDNGYLAYFTIDGKLQSISRSGKEILGITDDMRDLTFTELQLNKGYNKTWLDAFWQGIGKGNISKKETSMILNNKPTWFSETYFPVMNQTGTIEIVICLGIDITKSKENTRT